MTFFYDRVTHKHQVVHLLLQAICVKDIIARGIITNELNVLLSPS